MERTVRAELSTKCDHQKPTKENEVYTRHQQLFTSKSRKPNKEDIEQTLRLKQIDKIEHIVRV